MIAAMERFFMICLFIGTVVGISQMTFTAEGPGVKTDEGFVSFREMALENSECLVQDLRFDLVSELPVPNCVSSTNTCSLESKNLPHVAYLREREWLATAPHSVNASYSQVELFRSIDDGQTWTSEGIVTSTPSTTFRSALSVNDNTVVVALFEGLVGIHSHLKRLAYPQPLKLYTYISQDYGVTFVKKIVPFDMIGYTDSFHLAFDTSRNEMVFVGSVFNDTNAHLMTVTLDSSLNFGTVKPLTYPLSWVVKGNTYEPTLFVEHGKWMVTAHSFAKAVNDSSIDVSGGTVFMFVSYDSGDTWSRHTISDPFNPSYSPRTISSGNGKLLVTHTPSIFAWSTDGGRSFSSVGAWDYSQQSTLLSGTQAFTRSRPDLVYDDENAGMVNILRSAPTNGAPSGDGLWVAGLDVASGTVDYPKKVNLQPALSADEIPLNVQGQRSASKATWIITVPYAHTVSTDTVISYRIYRGVCPL